MTDINELRSWIAHAEDDFESARILIRRKKPLLYSACFHAQQCAEKYLKALLLFKDQEFPKVHDLNTLDDLCSGIGIFLGMDKTDLARLSAYAVMSRYPGEEPALDEAREAIETAKTVRRFARSYLGLKQ
ncbi:MAG TPA: HEPN domain-containing protein [Anaerolineales bacterium]|nr:HEPN domain-containing protein [Anaerolineales bacterium]